MRDFWQNKKSFPQTTVCLTWPGQNGCIKHFQMHCYKGFILSFDWNFTEICSWMTVSQHWFRLDSKETKSHQLNQCWQRDMLLIGHDELMASLINETVVTFNDEWNISNMMTWHGSAFHTGGFLLHRTNNADFDDPFTFAQTNCWTNTWMDGDLKHHHEQVMSLQWVLLKSVDGICNHHVGPPFLNMDLCHDGYWWWFYFQVYTDL